MPDSRTVEIPAPRGNSFAEAFARLTPKHFPIAHKLALFFTGITVLGMFSLGWVIFRDQTRLLEQQMGEFGFTIARQASESAKEPLLANDTLGLQVLMNNLVTDVSILGAAVYSEELMPMAAAGETPDPQLMKEIVAQKVARDWEAEGKGGTKIPVASFVAPIVFQDVTVGHAVLTFDRTFMEQAQHKTIDAIFKATLLLVFVGVITSILLGKRLTRPIYQIMDASRLIADGDYRFRFTERRNDELGALMRAMNTMNEGLLRKELVEKTFSRYVSPNVAKEVLADLEKVELGGRHVEASVLFADIVGFTSMSENLAPSEVSELLNEYFTYIAQAAEAFNGHVDKYIGDCAMLVFGVPLKDEEHSFHAAACGVVILRIVDRLNEKRRAKGLDPVLFRIGINSGTMLAGNMGSKERMEYTVVGDAVNLASRLGSVGGPGEIVISQEMHDDPRLVGRLISREFGSIQIKGKKEPVATYTINDIADGYRPLVDQRADAILNSIENDK